MRDGTGNTFKVSPSRNYHSLMNYFLDLPTFRYAKLYVYDRSSGDYLYDLCYFGRKKDGSVYYTLP